MSDLGNYLIKGKDINNNVHIYFPDKDEYIVTPENSVDYNIFVKPWIDLGNTLSPIPNEITADDVIAERTRRLALGFTYPFPDDRGDHVIGTTEEDLKNWDEVTKASAALILCGQSNIPITIYTNTGVCEVTAIEWQQILIYVGNIRQRLYIKSFILQAMNPIPQNYIDDIYW